MIQKIAKIAKMKPRLEKRGNFITDLNESNSWFKCSLIFLWFHSIGVLFFHSIG
jgi:hypothetical protein